ncbi:MAG: helix-turn-helix transcriptional regulator [Clostridia bacterium]|nr:helix-turn-helix transcriptional regulator [Clostridia bacterium]
MQSDLVIQKIHSAFDGEFNPGFIKRKGMRHSDCFVYYLYGSADYIFDDYTLNVSAGDSFYLAKNSLYDIRINEKSKYICIDFEFHPSKETRQSLLFKNVGIATSKYFLKFLHIRTDVNGGNIPKAFSMIYEIYFELLKRSNEKYLRGRGFDKINEYIVDSYSRPDISLESIARGTGFSESQIRRTLKSRLRITPLKYINFLRLEKAERLLSESNLSISEIAFATGFEDQFYFSRAFRKQYGISPMGYRRNNVSE